MTALAGQTVTVTAHIWIDQKGSGGEFGLWLKGQNSDYTTTPLASLPLQTWTNVVYHPGAAVDLATVTNLEFMIRGGAGSSPTTIWIDSVTVSGSTTAEGPFTFNASFAPIDSNVYNPQNLTGVTPTWKP
jgi:hypothetical protein